MYFYGDRVTQREGWPSNKEGNDPSPRWKELQKVGTEEKDIVSYSKSK